MPENHPVAEAATPLLRKEGCLIGRPFPLNRKDYLGTLQSVTFKRSRTDIHNLPELRTFRRELRSGLTVAEMGFWNMVKGSRLDGRKFRRQHSVGPYILDFYCPVERLAVELDGQVHFGDAAREYDHERKLFLKHFGILVLRFENRLIFEDPDWVLANICHRFGWWRIMQEDSP